MAPMKLARTMLWTLLGITLLAAIGGWRFYQVPAELRFAAHEAWWYVVPYIVLLGVLVVLLLLTKSSSGSDDHT